MKNGYWISYTLCRFVVLWWKSRFGSVLYGHSLGNGTLGERDIEQTPHSEWFIRSREVWAEQLLSVLVENFTTYSPFYLLASQLKDAWKPLFKFKCKFTVTLLIIL